jgi:BRCA1-associated protein
MTELARKLDKELREERAVSEGLMKNLGTLREKAEIAEKEKETIGTQVKEMEDQLRDVMFFLEARTKIENGEGGAATEAQGGSLEVVAPPPPSSAKKKKPRK